MLTATLPTPEEGFVFSFLNSEKFGTDCARGLSDSNLRRPEPRLETLADERGAGAVGVQGVESIGCCQNRKLSSLDTNAINISIGCCQYTKLSSLDTNLNQQSKYILNHFVR